MDEYQQIIDGLDDKNYILMILILLQEEEDTVIVSEREIFFFSRNWHVHLQVLGVEERRRCSGYIPRCALNDHISSAFSTLYRSNDGGALITVTRFDHIMFRYILYKFGPTYDRMTPYSENVNIMREMNIKKARPRTFDLTFGLALVLLNLCSRGGSCLIQMVFGANKSPLSLWIIFVMRFLLDV